MEEINQEVEEQPQVEELQDESMSEGQTEAQETEAKTEEQSLDELTFEPEQVEKFVKWMGVPKGVDHFIDRDKTLKFVVPINGKKYIQSPEEVIKGFGLNQAGYQKLEEAKNIINGNRDFYEQVKQDPRAYWELADRIGIDKRQLAYDLLNQYVEEEELSPEEKYNRKLKALEDQERQMEEARKKEAQDKEYVKLRDQEINRLNSEFKEALPSLGFKNYSPRTKMAVVNSAIEKIKFYNSLGKNLSIKDAVSLAKQEKMSLIQDYFGDLDDQRLLDTIPKSIVERLRAIDLANLSKNQASIPTSKAQIGGQVDLRQIDEARGTRKPSKQKQTVSEYFDSLGKG